jgi:hypothetical protein
MKYKITKLISVIIISSLIWQTAAWAQLEMFCSLRSRAFAERAVNKIQILHSMRKKILTHIGYLLKLQVGTLQMLQAESENINNMIQKVQQMIAEGNVPELWQIDNTEFLHHMNDSVSDFDRSFSFWQGVESELLDLYPRGTVTLIGRDEKTELTSIYNNVLVREVSGMQGTISVIINTLREISAPGKMTDKDRAYALEIIAKAERLLAVSNATIARLRAHFEYCLSAPEIWLGSVSQGAGSRLIEESI